MNELSLILAQINTTVGDLEGNRARIISTLRQINSGNPSLVIFPELTLSGYPPEDLVFRKGFLEKNRELLDKIAGQNFDIPFIVGFPENRNKIYNAGAVISSGEVEGIFRKYHLPNYGVFDEERYFSPASRACLLVCEGYKIGLTICEDIWEPVGPANNLVFDEDADLIVNLSASPFRKNKISVREKMLKRRAKQLGVPIVLVNKVGGQDELVFDGTSVVVDGRGEIKARAESFGEDLLLYHIQNVEGLKGESKQSGQRTVGELNTKRITIESSPDRKERQINNPELSEPPSEIGEIHSALTLGIRDYVRNNGFEQVVLGISGGIDSALSTVLAVHSLGKENVTGVNMPGPFSSESSIKDSEKLASSLGIELLSISIDDLYSNYLEKLRSHFEDLEKDKTEENLQARIRGNILMALSNKFDRLVIAPGNKSEFAVGYATLYGDMVGGFAPLKDVYKTEIYRLAGFINSGEEIIPREIIEKAPSAELKPDQKDTDVLPPYEILDSILEKLIEKNMSRKQIIERGFSGERVNRVANMLFKSEYKRRQAPPGVRISSKSFGKDRRFPITNKYKS